MRSAGPWSLFRCLLVVGIATLAPVTAHAADPPVITGLSSDHVPLDSFLTIHGANFGDAQGSSYVTVGAHQVPVLAWSAMAIDIYVNPLAYNQGPLPLDTAYPVQVIRRSDGKVSNTVNLTLTSGPAITGFNSPSACPTDMVTIYGVGFSGAKGHSTVTVTVPVLDIQGRPVTVEISIPVVGWADGAIQVVLLLPVGVPPGTYILTVHRSDGQVFSAPITVGACG